MGPSRDVTKKFLDQFGGPTEATPTQPQQTPTAEPRKRETPDQAKQTDPGASSSPTPEKRDRDHLSKDDDWSREGSWPLVTMFAMGTAVALALVAGLLLGLLLRRAK
jgi:hypothetical protein